MIDNFEKIEGEYKIFKALQENKNQYSNELIALCSNTGYINVHAFKYLIKISDVNYQNNQQVTPLMALLNRIIDYNVNNEDDILYMVQELIDNGAKLYYSVMQFIEFNINYKSALVYSAMHGHYNICKLLLKHDNINGCPISLHMHIHGMALLNASCYGHYNICKLLLDYNIEHDHPIINYENSLEFITNKINLGHTALINACINGHLNIIKLLFEYNITVINNVTLNGDNALMYCLLSIKPRGRVNISLYVEIIEILLKNNINLSQTNTKGNNVLHIACEKGYVQIVQSIVSYITTHSINSDTIFNTQNINGFTPLIISASKGYNEIVEILTKYCDPNISNTSKNTALILACENNHFNTVKTLLKHPKLKINSQNNNGNSALLQAIYYGHYNIVKILLSHGANVSYLNNDNNNALIYAAFNNHYDICELILEYGRNIIDINYYNKFNYTAYDYATRNKNTKLQELLLHEGATTHYIFGYRW